MGRATGWPWRTAAVVAAVALLAPLAMATGPGPTVQPPAAGGNDPAVACQDLRAGALVACLHGNDVPPPGVSLYERPTLAELEDRTSLGSSSPRLRGLAALEQATRPTAATAPAALACIGNGTSGNRVQTIYARAPDVPDRYAAVLPSLRQWAAEADQAVWVSAGQTGGGRRLRFVTQAVTEDSCQLQVAQAVLTPLGVGDFGQMVTELEAQGFNRSDRKYLVWVDAADGICGLGEVYGDARPGPENYNNGGPMYARVDAPCWHYAELHEIFHTLGAVQPDAPHPSAALHCTDEADVMCYDDDAGGPVRMSIVCPPEHEALLDCRSDDYFSTAPPAGSYLASHWNTATSSFLQDVDAPRPAQLSLARAAATITYGGRASLRGRLTDSQTSAGVAGTPVNLFARRAGASGEQAAGSTSSTSDGSSSFSPAPAHTTAYRASFPGSDTHGTASSSQVTVGVRTKVTARKSASTIRYGQSITLTGTVGPNHHGHRVYLQRLVGGSWKTAATGILTRGSGYTLRVKPPARGRLSYRVYKSADDYHLAGASPSQVVTVR